MRSNVIDIFFSILASLLSAVLLVLAFPPYDFSWLVWIALVPLLVAGTGRNPILGFLLWFLFGVAFFTGIFRWIFEVPGYRFHHHFFIGLYLGPLVGVFGLASSLITKRLGIMWAYLAAPFLWTSLEYVRANLFFLSLPWAFLAHSQYQNLALIQIASICGAYGVSFLIVMVNAAAAFLILSLLHRFRPNNASVRLRVSTGQLGFVAIGAALMVIITLSYGYVALSDPLVGKELRTTVVQGNIDRTMKASPARHAEFIMAKYTSLSRAACADGAELIVWPEASTPGFVLKNHKLRSDIVSLVREINRHFVVGSSEYAKFMNVGDLKGRETGNAALFISPEGRVLGQYLKIHLVPFGEHVPLEGKVPWPGFIVSEGKKGFEIPGKEYTLFEIKEARFGVVICWEIVFPELFREFVKRGADFMLNLTNEGWFGETAAPYQMLSMSVFRSVENRISMARAANTGISCFIDPAGRVTGRVQKNGKDIFVDGYLTQGISLSPKRTFYTAYGDVFAYVVFGIAAGFVVLAILPSRVVSFMLKTIREVGNSE